MFSNHNRIKEKISNCKVSKNLLERDKDMRRQTTAG